jgi:AcrR family transcriptional regulator
MSMGEVTAGRAPSAAKTNTASRPRLSSEERREQLLACGVELLGQRSPEELSLEEIAAAAGVSEGLLYHYFSTKEEFLLAALRRSQAELIERLAPDPALEPSAQLEASLEAFLDYVEEHKGAFVALVSGSGADHQIAAARDAGRERYVQTLLEALGRRNGSAIGERPSPALRVALQGWMFFVDGAVLAWLQQGGLKREQLREILRSGLGGALRAAQAGGAQLNL